MPQVQICSISEYSVTDWHHLQPTGVINQQSWFSKPDLWPLAPGSGPWLWPLASGLWPGPLVV